MEPEGDLFLGELGELFFTQNLPPLLPSSASLPEGVGLSQDSLEDIQFQNEVEGYVDRILEHGGDDDNLFLALASLPLNQSQNHEDPYPYPVVEQIETDPVTQMMIELLELECMDNLTEQVTTTVMTYTPDAISQGPQPQPLRPQTLHFRSSPNPENSSNFAICTTADPAILTTTSSYSPVTPSNDETQGSVLFLPSMISGDNSYDIGSYSDSNGSLTPSSPTSPTVGIVCPVCQAVLRHPKGYRRHYKRKHANVVSFPCRICQKPLANRTVRYTHEKSHLGLEELTDADVNNANTSRFRERCPTCSKLFWDRTLFRRHTTVHSEDRPFSCSLCIDKRYKVKSALTRHYKTVHCQEQPANIQEIVMEEGEE